ncbi:Hypothetical protein CINCED_3A005850 [Cinara cedri]|uniref:Uncharacterized protein n=1 Tax=Cinara cedri TaxID=506608 RepID=A0A5E4N3A0_9HEMI|nr:Hypothetical protein CINCED_3A005850 [Cinara cedri]
MLAAVKPHVPHSECRHPELLLLYLPLTEDTVTVSFRDKPDPAIENKTGQRKITIKDPGFEMSIREAVLTAEEELSSNKYIHFTLKINLDVYLQKSPNLIKFNNDNLIWNPRSRSLTRLHESLAEINQIIESEITREEATITHERHTKLP